MKRIEQICPLDTEAMKRAEKKWNRVAKPLHSLGLLEEMVIKMAGMTESEEISLEKKCVVVMCSDNGVVAEGVTQSPCEVTGIVARAMAQGDGNINNLCRKYQADLKVVDVGMKTTLNNRKILNCKVREGTGNITKEPAMTIQECEQIICRGMDLVKNLKKEGYRIIATGEMGIGNTTTSSAIASVLLQCAPHEVTGRGAGLSKDAVSHKIQVIEKAISFHQPNRSTPMEVLSKLGGFDIAGMAGLFLGGAVYRIPVVIDGYISSVAAALARQMAPLAVDYMLPSHVSGEPAAQRIMTFLGLKPVLTAQMCLGEGTGAVMLFPLLEGALEIYSSGHLFSELKLEQYKEFK